jgi:hypothetical protein
VQLFKSSIDPEERKALLHQLASSQAFDAVHAISAHLVSEEQDRI